MCVCLFSALSRRVGALQISIIMIMIIMIMIIMIIDLEVNLAGLLGGHDAQQRQKQDGYEGGDGQR